MSRCYRFEERALVHRIDDEDVGGFAHLFDVGLVAAFVQLQVDVITRLLQLAGRGRLLFLLLRLLLLLLILPHNPDKLEEFQRKEK